MNNRIKELNQKLQALTIQEKALLRALKSVRTRANYTIGRLLEARRK